MAEEKKIANEVLSDNELDEVSGGNAAQSNYDQSMFATLGLKGNLVDNFKGYNILFSQGKKGDNAYSFMGYTISQDTAHDIVKWQSQGYSVGNVYKSNDGGAQIFFRKGEGYVDYKSIKV